MAGDPHQRAFEAALRAIAARERTEQELRELLARRGFEPDVIDDVVLAAREDGFVDDAGYARRFAEDRRLLDQWGSDRIARDLARRGVERDLVDEVLSDRDRSDELAVAVELLDRRFPTPFDGDRERDKAWRVLVRRGYEPQLAYDAVKMHERGLRDAA